MHAGKGTMPMALLDGSPCFTSNFQQMHVCITLVLHSHLSIFIMWHAIPSSVTMTDNKPDFQNFSGAPTSETVMLDGVQCKLESMEAAPEMMKHAEDVLDLQL
jgi:hypothetical protein